MKYLFYSLLLILVSCSEVSEKKTDEEQSIPVNATIHLLKGKWIEEDDSLHVVEFTASHMIENYGGSEINRYPTTFFEGLPGDGGYEEATGRVIQVEESKDNYHHFTIIILDSFNLELLHRTSGKNQIFKRLKSNKLK